MIRQSELQDLARTLAALQELETAARLQKRVLMDRLDAGEAVRPGKLSAVIIESAARRFSESALASAVGPAEAARLKSLLPETVSRSLKLIQS